MAHSDRVGQVDEHENGSSWQPVQPTSRRERARYRSGRFTPLIGTSFDEPAALDAGPAASPGKPGTSPARGQQPSAPAAKKTHRGHVKPRAYGSADAAAGHVGGRQRPKPDAAGSPAVSPAGGIPSAGARPAPPKKRASAQGGTDNATNGTGNAVAAAIMGALSIVLAPSSAVFSIVLAIIAFGQAGKARKHGRRAGVGRVLASLGIVLSALSVIAGFGGIGALVDDVLDGKSYMQAPESYRNATDATDDMINALDLTGSEQTVAELAEQQYGKLVEPDEETLQTVASMLDEDMEARFGISHADLGVDPLETARWALADSSYAISSVYAFDDDGEGDAFADVRVRDTGVLYEALSDAVYERGSRTDSGELDAASLPRVAEAYREALQQQPGELEDRFVDIEFDLVDGEWKVDEAYWESTLENLYGM